MLEGTDGRTGRMIERPQIFIQKIVYKNMVL